MFLTPATGGTRKSASSDQVTGVIYDFSKPGETTVTIRVGRATASFPITVVSNTVEATILVEPSQKVFTLGGELKIEGIAMFVHDSSGGLTVIPQSDLTVSLPANAMNEVGEHTVSVHYNSRPLEVHSFSIQVVPQGTVGFIPGDVDGSGTIGIGDVLEILKFLAGMSSTISDGGKGSPAWEAALIVSKERPAIGDALEILKYLAKMTSLLG